MRIISLVATVAILLTASSAIACDGWMCFPEASFEGISEQTTYAGLTQGDIVFNTDNNYESGVGSILSGNQNSAASFEGTFGDGEAFTTGVSTGIQGEFVLGDGGIGYYTGGMVANTADVNLNLDTILSTGSIEISGEGQLGTFSAAVFDDNMAIGSSSGSFEYEASQNCAGSLSGYGTVIGGSVAYAGPNIVFSAATNYTAAGAHANK